MSAASVDAAAASLPSVFLPARKPSSQATYEASANKWYYRLYLKSKYPDGYDPSVVSCFLKDDGAPDDCKLSDFLVWLYEQDVHPAGETDTPDPDGGTPGGGMTKSVYKNMIFWAQSMVND